VFHSTTDFIGSVSEFPSNWLNLYVRNSYMDPARAKNELVTLSPYNISWRCSWNLPGLATWGCVIGPPLNLSWPLASCAMCPDVEDIRILNFVRCPYTPFSGPGSLNPTFRARGLSKQVGDVLQCIRRVFASNLHMKMGENHCTIDRIIIWGFSTFWEVLWPALRGKQIS